MPARAANSGTASGTGQVGKLRNSIWLSLDISKVDDSERSPGTDESLVKKADSGTDKIVGLLR